MRKSRVWKMLFLLIIAVLSCGVCRAASEPLYKGKIVIGNAIWPGYLALYVAQDKGYFKEAGLDVEIKNYVGLAEVSKDYVAGKLQGRADLSLDAVKERLEGLDHKIVLAIDYSNGSDTILAGAGVLSISDLKGKRVAYEAGTSEEFFLTWALTENNMQLSDVVAVQANPEEATKALMEGRADAAVTYEPFSSKAVSAGSHLIYSSADALGLITDVLSFRSDFINAYPETVHAFIRAYFKALDFWKQNPAEAQAIAAIPLGDTPEGVAIQLKGVKLLDRHDNAIAFTFSSGLQSLYGNLRQTGKFVHNNMKNTAAATLDTDKLIEKKFVKAVNADL